MSEEKETKTDHGFKRVLGRYIIIKHERRYHGLLMHLPDLITCPDCGEESNDIVYCVECGRTWINECGHGSEVTEEGHRGINIAELRRRKGDGELHAYPMIFRGAEEVDV